MSETAPAPAPAEVNPQANNQLLAAMGDESAQRQLDAAAYFAARPETPEEIVDAPKPHELVENAAQTATSEYESKSFKQLIEDLNSTRSSHKESMQVVDKNGNVVTRRKNVEADPTKADDLFDALAAKLANSELSDDGILTALGQMDKNLQLTGDEVSSVIDKIHAAREAKTKAVETASSGSDDENMEAVAKQDVSLPELDIDTKVSDTAYEESKTDNEVVTTKVAPSEAEEPEDIELAEDEEVVKPQAKAQPVANPFATAPTTEPVQGMDAPVAVPKQAEDTKTPLAAPAGFAAPANEKLMALGDAESGPIMPETLTPEQLIAISNQERTPENMKKIELAEAEMARRLVEGEPKKAGELVPFVKADDSEPIPTTAVEVETDKPERKRRLGRRLAAAGLVAAAAVGGFFAAKEIKEAVNRDNKAAVETTIDDTSNKPVENPFNGGSADAPISEASNGSERTPGADNTPASPEAPATDEHVFTVEVPYTDGAPTAWSWAESLGVTDIPGFLKEVMGDDWRDIARNMKVGDSISVSDEEIAQFSK